MTRRRRFEWEEARRNIAAWRWMSMLIAVAAAVGSSYVVASTLRTVDSAVGEAAELDRQGRSTLRVTHAERAEFAGAFCERLRSVGGIDAAYGIAAPGTLTLSTKADVAYLRVTDGFRQHFAPSAARPDGLFLVGADAGRSLGMVDGAILTPVGAAPDPAPGPVPVMVIPRTSETGFFDDAVVAVAPPTEPVTECRVVSSIGDRDRLIDIVRSTYGAPGILVEALAPEIELVRDPENRVRRVPGNPAVLLIGGLLSGATLSWWYGRRAEWALYRSFGFSAASGHRIAGLEWVLVVVAPTVVGAGWTFGFADVSTSRLAVELASWNLLASTALAACCLPIWVVLTERRSTIAALKGA